MGIFQLPDGYHEIKRINLQKNKKLAILVNVGALLIAALFVCIGLVISPSVSFEIAGKNLIGALLSLLLWLVSMVAYFVGHELVHGIFIKKFSGKRAKYGFTGMYAYAGSDAFFNKRQYIIIALAPVIIFGIIFGVLNLLLPAIWFWAVYFLQIINLSGAAGDLYVTYLMCKSPADILTHDEGFEMIFYSIEKPKN